MQQELCEKRNRSRTDLHSYHCIEVQTLEMLFKYQFKIWNTSAYGMCLLVQNNSDFLNKVSVGEILDVNYFPSDLSCSPDIHQTEIMHITCANDNKFKNHLFVGIQIVNSTSQGQTNLTLQPAKEQRCQEDKKKNKKKKKKNKKNKNKSMKSVA